MDWGWESMKFILTTIIQIEIARHFQGNSGMTELYAINACVINNLKQQTRKRNNKDAQNGTKTKI
jgi:hypothetical protein